MMKDIIIFDLDGTLADCSHRLHYIQQKHGAPKDWDAFYAACDKDVVIEHGVAICRMIQGFQLYVVTGRSDKTKELTGNWLFKKGIYPNKLIMRPDGDHTPDYDLKRRWVEDGTVPKDRIFCVFEDRSRVVKMWRDMGIPCFQVADGDF